MRRGWEVLAIDIDGVTDKGAAAVTVAGVSGFELEELNAVGEAVEKGRHFDTGWRGVGWMDLCRGMDE